MGKFVLTGESSLLSFLCFFLKNFILGILGDFNLDKSIKAQILSITSI